ncbi:MAG TPA: M20/M25/M40 family metallo-hydrolase [Phototrophicaceae bacterium]|jgi:acetylornithine deacetylase/succinyl-diaminopimelate desuccinylase-like protein|nr:M20/M25/M40 family metallo-hydrolase [Phototrophicaceae bacterium]
MPTPIYERPAELLQNLIRFDTTNPPGNEAACIAYVDGLLREAGFETTIVGKIPERTNLITRLKGTGDAPPLLIYGHLDVVPTAGQNWQHPPFAGELIDGYVWGRGALDMKGPDTMLICALLRAKAEGTPLPGDVILALVSDEEVGGEYGARYLVENHAHHFEGVKYALGEFGGFSTTIAGKRFYPIMLAERRVCTIQATFRGAGGHAAQRHTGTAMGKLGKALTILDSKRLPVHVHPVVEAMIKAIASGVDEPIKSTVLGLLDTTKTDMILDAMGMQAQLFDPLMHNTANPTIVQGGTKSNVIPSEIKVTLDGRLIPGITTAEFLAELRAHLGDDVELEPIIDDGFTGTTDMAMFETLAGILREADPEGVAIPYVLSGATDGRIFARLGIQTYGFVPMLLPPDFNFAATVHAADERIPVSALEFGTNAVFKALQRFG